MFSYSCVSILTFALSKNIENLHDKESCLISTIAQSLDLCEKWKFYIWKSDKPSWMIIRWTLRVSKRWDYSLFNRETSHNTNTSTSDPSLWGEKQELWDERKPSCPRPSWMFCRPGRRLSAGTFTVWYKCNVTVHSSVWTLYEEDSLCSFTDDNKSWTHTWNPCISAQHCPHWSLPGTG